MEISFNCYVLSSSDTFTIDIYKEKDIRYTMLGGNKYGLTVFKIGNILNFICNRNKVDISVMRGVKLWKVNVKKSEIKKNVHTEEDIININGQEMEPEELFEEYFKDELNKQNYIVSNIHIIAIISTTG
ncbi:hypothetical protein C1646_777450, partial [Rhizophagus diaphanus]